MSNEEFQRWAGRIEQKIDALLDTMPDHEKRIRWTERIVLALVVSSGVVWFDIGKDVIQAALGG